MRAALVNSCWRIIKKKLKRETGKGVVGYMIETSVPVGGI
jgi:hypothetical protein